MRQVMIAMIIALFIFGMPGAAAAHGMDIEYEANRSYDITATYDTGEPVSEGQVVIYAPGNPSEPWDKGTLDENGRYTFSPDFSQEGTWDIQVRKAGHGDMIHVQVGESDEVEVSAESTGFTTLQKVIMAACVLWGFVGTALFFSRRKS